MAELELQHTATHYNTLQHTATHFTVVLERWNSLSTGELLIVSNRRSLERVAGGCCQFGSWGVGSVEPRGSLEQRAVGSLDSGVLVVSNLVEQLAVSNPGCWQSKI